MVEETTTAEESQDTAAEPEQQTSEPTLLPGQQLQHAREAARLTIEEVSGHLHLDVPLIRALEQDDYNALPSAAYICGYLRSYARLLKLPEDEIVQAYNKGNQVLSQLIPENMTIRPERSENSTPMKLVTVLVLSVAIFAGAAWLLDKYELLSGKAQLTSSAQETNVTEEDILSVPPSLLESAHENAGNVSATINTETAEPANVEPLPLPHAEPDAAEVEVLAQTATDNAAAIQADVSAAGGLRLVYRDESWTSVIDANGKKLVYRLVPKDTQLAISGTPPYTIRLGKAAVVDVWYEGKSYDHSAHLRGDIADFSLGTQQN